MMEKATPASRKKLVEWIKVLVVAALIAVAMVFGLMLMVKDTRSKLGRITSPPGVATGLRQIQIATVMYSMQEGKSPSSLEDLVGMRVPTPEGQLTNFSIAMLEQQLGAKTSAIKYFPGFRILDYGQVPSREIVLAYIPESNDPQYCQVLYLGYETKGMKWVGAERMEVARVNRKVEWLTAYKNCIETNLPLPNPDPRKWPQDWCRPSAPMPD